MKLPQRREFRENLDAEKQFLQKSMLRSIEHSSLISRRDVELYKKFFSKDYNSRRDKIAIYSNSWLYVTQACRGFGLGLKVHEGDFLLSVGCYLRHGCLHYVLVRPLGCLNHKVILILDKLKEISQRPVFIKKIFPDQVNSLNKIYEKKLIVPIRKSCYYWDKSALEDDDTYPEMIYDLRVSTLSPQMAKRKIALLEKEDSASLGSSSSSLDNASRIAAFQSTSEHFKKYWEKVRHFQRHHVSAKGEVVFREYSPSDLAPCRALISNRFGVDTQQSLAYHNLLYSEQEYSLQYEKQFLRYVVLAKGSPEPIGFFCVEVLDTFSVGLYGAIVSYSDLPKGSSEYLHRMLMTQLLSLEFRYLSRGGSETLGLHKFKEKFSPITTCDMPIFILL